VNDLCVIRPAQQGDLAFARETTCRVRWPNGVPWADWALAYGHLVDLWVERGGCWVADAGDDTLLGFVVASDELVRMLYVKRDFRGNRLGRALLEAAGTSAPHVPNTSWALWSRTWSGS
jgi:GNAT superfamily N-acetyltransferase